MAFRINHIHIKAADPRKVADWWAAAFALEILSDETRPFGDRFIRCRTGDGAMLVTISGARTGETLGPGNASPRHGLEHIAIEVDNIEADIARLVGLGARLQEGPIDVPGVGIRVAFIEVPETVRVELMQMPK